MRNTISSSRQEELAILLDSLPIGVLIAKDVTCVHIVGNKAANKLLKRRGGDNLSVLSSPRHQVFHKGGELANEELPLVRAARGETITEQELEIRFTDGSDIHVTISASPLYDHEGKLRGSVASIQDISKLKYAERRYREISKQLQVVLDNAPAYIYQMDKDNRYVFVNKAYSELVGQRAENLIGAHVSKIFAPEVARHYIENNESLLKKPGIRSFEEIAPWEDGVHYYNSIKAPIFDENGQPSSILGISTDITERIRMMEQLREADRRKDEFLAVLGHELRNPLSPLSMGLDLMAHAEERPELIKDTLPMMKRQVAQLTRLVDDLLNLSRINRGRIELKMDRIDLNLVAEAALEQVKPLVKARRHEFVLDKWPEPLMVQGDFERLTQVLGNLLTNAAKYMDPGGTVTLRTGRDDGHALASVIDKGYGIPKDQLENVFQMFAQVAEHRQHTGGGGLGIGLSLARQLVEMHEGRLTVESEPGQGTEFHLSLALTEREAAVAPPARESAENRPLRILVVDDNRDAARSVTEVLRLRNHEVRVAYDGHEALALLQEFTADSVLLDIGLPELDGYEVARRIRAMPEGGSLHLIALTGLGQEEDKARSRDAGIDVHLTKPVEPDLLFATLARS